MFDNNEQSQSTNIKPIIVNGVGSPIQIKIKSAVSSKTNKPYDYLQVLIGEWEIRNFFQSPLEKKEAQRVLDIINKANSTIN